MRSAREGLDLQDLDLDRAAVGRLVGGLVADLEALDRGSERARLAVDVEVGAAAISRLPRRKTSSPPATVADDGARLDDAAAGRGLADLGRLQQRLERADARLDLALLVLGGVVAAVLLEVASSRATSMRLAISSRPTVERFSSSATRRS
jgi:uncharacterized protein YejL (UPF0352 family)